MALKKLITTAQGFTPEYHRIQQLEFGEGTVTVHLAVYKDQAARQAGKPPAERLVVKLQTSASDRAEIYALLAAGPLAGAENV